MPGLQLQGVPGLNLGGGGGGPVDGAMQGAMQSMSTAHVCAVYICCADAVASNIRHDNIRNENGTWAMDRPGRHVIMDDVSLTDQVRPPTRTWVSKS